MQVVEVGVVDGAVAPVAAMRAVEGLLCLTGGTNLLRERFGHPAAPTLQPVLQRA
jgi:hypothetical protein